MGRNAAVPVLSHTRSGVAPSLAHSGIAADLPSACLSQVIEEMMIGEDRMIHFSGCALNEACTIVLRGASERSTGVLRAGGGRLLHCRPCDALPGRACRSCNVAPAPAVPCSTLRAPHGMPMLHLHAPPCPPTPPCPSRPPRVG